MPIVIETPTAPPPPLPADDAPQLWEMMYRSLGFHVEDDAATAYTLRRFCEAWCAPMQATYDIVRERPGFPAWSILLDPDNCPADSLPYLAQFVGVVITPQMSEEQIREEIKEPTGWARGREPAIRLAGARTLEPVADEPLVIVIRTRTPEVGWHYIRTLATQTPDPERTEAVFRDAIPAWEALDYQAFDGPTYADLDAGYADYAALDTAFAHYSEIPESPLP